MDGGTALTAAKNVAREELLVALRQIAAFVQSVAGEDEPLLLTSGFSAVIPGRSPQTKLSAPNVVGVENGETTQLTVRLEPVPYAKSYEVRATNGAKTPPASTFSTQARRIIVGNLTPGTTYNIQARAIGGSDGFSAWSDPVAHMAT